MGNALLKYKLMCTNKVIQNELIQVCLDQVN